MLGQVIFPFLAIWAVLRFLYLAARGVSVAAGILPVIVEILLLSGPWMFHQYTELSTSNPYCYFNFQRPAGIT